MAVQKLLPNQLFEGKSWNGFTPKQHLVNVYEHNPVDIFDKVIQLYDVNLGEDFVSMVMKHGIHEIKPDTDEYQWKLDNVYDTYFELEACWEDYAGTVSMGTNVTKPGAARTKFYMDFVGNNFTHTETIVGERPDLYTVYVVDSRNVGGDIWRLECQLASAKSAEDFIPMEELEVGTRWSSEAGLVTDTLSDRGMDIRFKSKTMLNGFLSSFRLQHTLAGNMTKIKPLGFFVEGSNKPMWITNVEYEFMKKARYATAALVMNGKSNRWSDGTYGNYDKNGYAIKAGSGFKEQWAASNKYTYGIEPDLDFLTEVALDATVGKVSRKNRKMVIRGGEWGIMELSKMVQRKIGSDAIKSLSYLQDTTGRAFKWSGNDLSVNLGQFTSVALINGIEFYFMIDPLKDDPARNKIEHPKGGLASSYEYDIMGFGGMDEKSNMKIVRRQGEAPMFGAVEGMRGFFDKGSTSFMNPKHLSTSVDGTTMHFYDPGVGAIVYDPTKVIQYYPEITA